VNAIINNIPQIINAGIQLLVALVKNTPKIIIEVVKAIPQIITEIVRAIINCIPQIAQTGLQLIQGLWQGISDAGAWLRDKISGFFGGVVSSIKNFFGIKSPSTLFRDQIGKNMALGIGVGFADKMDDVGKAMQEAIPTTLDAPDLDINAGISTSLYGGNSVGGAFSLADIVGRLDSLSEIMVQLFDIKVVLDDGTLVGKLAPEIDRNLALLRKRGLVGV
jgi:phage-related protein